MGTEANLENNKQADIPDYVIEYLGFIAESGSPQSDRAKTILKELNGDIPTNYSPKGLLLLTNTHP